MYFLNLYIISGWIFGDYIEQLPNTYFSETRLIFLQASEFSGEYKTQKNYENGTVTRKLPVNSNGRMERLMCNFHYLGYYCSPNLSIHQNRTQEPTWNFLVTLARTVK